MSLQSQITRVEVHFSDENGGKGGANDKRCVMEARLAGRKPIAVTDQADTFDEVIDGAAEKLKHALKKILVPGARGHKDLTKDINDIIDTMQRKLEMIAENEKKL